MKSRGLAGSLAAGIAEPVGPAYLGGRLCPGTTAERTYKIISFCVLFCSILTLRDYVLDLGHPYLWVQKLGGLHFPKEQPQVCTLIWSSWLGSSPPIQTPERLLMAFEGFKIA